MNEFHALPKKKNPKILISLILILIITFVSFYPSLKNNFTNWDDDIYVLQNPIIKDLSPKGIIKNFTSFHRGLYKPLVLLSFALEYHFFKFNPIVYHSTNLILHLFNCALVFLFFFILTNEYPVAFIVALLFGIHPLHVESVAWITERKDLLYSFFLLGATIFYLCHIKTKTKKFFWISLFLFVLSLLSKPMAISFPIMLLTLDYFLDIKYNKAAISKKIPFFIIAVAFLVITLGTAKSFIYHQAYFNSIDNILIAAFGIIFYLTKLFLPLNLSCFYPYPAKANGLLPLIYLLSPVVLIFLIIIVVISLRYTKKILFGALFFLCSILPALQLLPTGPAIVADRYTYISSLGLFYVIGVGIVWFYAKKLKNKAAKVFFSGFLIFIVAILSFLTWNRCKAWKDGITLWSDALNKYPNSALIYNNLGVAYSDRGEYDKAIADYNQALKIDPYYAESYNNLGVAFVNKKKYDKAVAEFHKTLAIDPTFSEAYYNLAMIYGINGNDRAVILFCKKAIRANPGYAQAYAELCVAYGKLGDFQESIACGEKAVEINPELASAHINLSVGYYYTKQYDLAIRHCDKAIGLGYPASPDFLEALKPYRR